MKLFNSNSAQKGCEIVDTKEVNGIGWLQIKTLRTGKLWPIQYKLFVERFDSEQYTTEDERECTQLSDLVGVIFDINIINDNPF
jgi:hypothetical protein